MLKFPKTQYCISNDIKYFMFTIDIFIIITIALTTSSLFLSITKGDIDI